MLNYAVDPLILRRWVPHGTELDTWNGIAFVSVVGFRFLRTRVLGIPIPAHRHFPEVNLRLYVRARSGSEIRRGVTFIREIVPRLAIARIAVAAYNEPYVARRMRSSFARASNGRLVVSYGWRHRQHWNVVSAEAAAGEPELPCPGSQEEFIAEHYWGYTTQRDGSTIEYQVVHPQWRVWPAINASLVGDAAAVWHPDLAHTLRASPYSAFIAEGSAVLLHRPQRSMSAASRL